MNIWKVDHLDHEFVPTVAGAPAIDDNAGADPIATFAPDALQFQLQLGKLGPSTVSYELGLGAIDEISGDPGVTEDFVGAYRTDFSLRCTDLLEPLLAGMHTPAPAGTDGDPPMQAVQIAGMDWLHYLDRRKWPYDATLSYIDWPDGLRFRVAAGEVGQLVKDILETVRDVSPNWPAAPDAPGAGGNPSYSLGFTVDADSTGTTINFEISPMDSTSILQMIQTLSDAAAGNGGFDFYMTPDKVFRLVAPALGDVGSPIFTLEVDGTTHLTPMRSTGMTNTGPAGTHFLGVGAGSSGQGGGVNRHFRANSAVYRRLDEVVDFGDVKNLDLLESLTGSALANGANPILEIPITVDPSMIANFWTLARPGKFVTVNYDLRFHALASAQKIVSMDCQVDQEGNELVTLGFNRGDRVAPAAGLDDF